MITTQEQLLTLLNTERIAYQLYEHPAIFTAQEASQHCTHIPGAHVKNLFVRNKKKTAYWLITVKDEKRVDLIALGKQLQTERLSFVNNESLFPMLGVYPGSVTPFAILNDLSCQVISLFDHDLMHEEHISVHPMQNTATVCVKLRDLILLVESRRKEKIEFINLPLL